MYHNSLMVKCPVVHIYHEIVVKNDKELFIHKTTRVNLKGIILSEKSQSRRTNILVFQSDKSIELEKKLVVARGQGWWGLAGEGRCDFKGVVGGRKSFVTGGYMNLHMWQIGVEL